MVNLEERISLAKDLKRFAVEELGISSNPSFEKVSSRKEYYNIYCSRKDRIEPAVNELGTLQFCRGWEWNDRRRWKKSIKELQHQDIDIYPVTFGALGFETCPITRSLLDADIPCLAYIVLHENVHIHCSKNSFNLPLIVEEAVANCFAYSGALAYFNRNDKLMVEHIEKYIQYFFIFDDWVNSYSAALKAAYASGIEKGRAMLKEAHIQLYGNRSREFAPLNNAFFLAQGLYSTNTKKVWERLKDIHPREYMANKDLLYEKLGALFPPKAE